MVSFLFAASAAVTWPDDENDPARARFAEHRPGGQPEQFVGGQWQTFRVSEVHHLPPELSSFVGRSAELDAIEAVVAAGRLVTLVGPGGCGKSRLAMRLGARLAPRWPDGVWWVDLASENDADLVVARIAASTELPVPESEAVRTLTHGLRDRDLVLVLDNCEHLVGGVAWVVSAILTTCPRVAVVATSQAPIDVAGEHVWRVPPLTLGDALDLLLERSGHADDATGRAGARRICDRLDRLPLALELAAGWAGTLSTQQIAESLRDPFALLDEGPRNAPFRQQTLAGSMRWSHDLLDDDERVLFRRLGAFEPGFTADAVRDVGGFAGLEPSAVLRALRGLIAKSLVLADTSGPVARYRLLGVVREYARIKLDEAGESDAVRARHLDTYLAIVDRHAPLLDTDKDTWRERMHPEYVNVRAAIEWGLTREDTAPARRLASATAWLWHLESRGREGLRLLRLAAERGSGEHSVVQARVLVSLALVADTAGPEASSYDAARSAAELADEVGDTVTSRLARALVAIGLIASDFDAARDQAIRVRDDAAAAGDAFVEDGCEVLIGLVDLLRDEDKAIAPLHDAADRLLTRGDRGVAATALTNLSLGYARRGDLVGAEELAERAVAAAKPLRNFHHNGTAASALAEVRTLQGRRDDAAAALAPIGRLVGDSEPIPFIPGWARAVALLALSEDHPDRAVTWCRREPGWQPEQASDAALTPETQVVLAMALRAAGEDGADPVLERAATAAEHLRLPRVRAAVLEQRALHLGETDVEGAYALHHEALRVRDEHGLVLGCIDSLEAIAGLAMRRGNPETAAVLAGAAERARSKTGYAVHVALPPAHSELAGQELVAAYERGRRMELGEAVTYASRARGPRRRPDSGWDSLTPTELDVVDLAVAGLNNPQIAERLYMSRGTVKAHLGHVYAKLGIGNRTELARIAGERPTAAADRAT
jgi:predicted ATPase/DNA-binding CsgD family transcriptional regulator